MTQGDTKRCDRGQISLYINSRPCPSLNQQRLVIAVTIRLIVRFARPAAPANIHHLVTPIQVPLTHTARVMFFLL